MNKQRGMADGWILLGLIVLICLGLWRAYYVIDERGFKRAEAECAARAKVQRDKELKQSNRASKGLEKSNESARKEFSAIESEVDRLSERPVDCGDFVDDDGLRNLNRALGGSSADTGEPDRAVPKTNAAADKGSAGSAKKDR